MGIDKCCNIVDCMFFFQAEDGIRDLVRSRGLGDVYKRQGRHGLLCFNKEYLVITEAEGIKSTFTITTIDDKHPFSVKNSEFEMSRNHGTRLEVIVQQNLPKPERILDIISVSYTHLRAHETVLDLVCRLLLEKKNTH